MHYEKRFLHRIQEEFLIVGSGDFENLMRGGSCHERYIELSLDALHCLVFFPDIEYLILTPGEVSSGGLRALDGLRIKALKLDYHTYEIDAYTIDLACFPLLELVFARTQYCFKNISQCHNLQTLIVQEWLTNNLEWLKGSPIKALKLFSGKLKSLNGIQKLQKLVSLSIANQRQLVDCDDLAGNRLESIEIISCNKTDIALFPIMQEVRMMHISGKRLIPNVEIILHIAPRLEWLLLDHIVSNGELASLTDLLHAVIFTDCRHYSHKNCELPKAAEGYHSKHLPKELEILPEAY